jgi:UDP-N-acetylmuramate dehydrogenase
MPEDPLSIRNLMVRLKKESVPFFTLGGGTNVLVRDGGIEGVVLSLKEFRRIEVIREGNSDAEIFVEAGVPLQKLVNFCKEHGFAGVEGLTGIPGSVGGAICGNAGSYGCEMKDTLLSVAIMDADGRLDRFKAEGLEFAYRKSGITPADIVLSANMKLRRDDGRKSFFPRRNRPSRSPKGPRGASSRMPKTCRPAVLSRRRGAKA